MIEASENNHTHGPHQQLEYAAVPLDAHRAMDPETHETYYYASMQRLQRKLGEATVEMLRYDWVNDFESAVALHNFVRLSLHDSHKMRIDRNSSWSYHAGGNVDDPRMELARKGHAIPSELFGLVADHHEIGSIELAKLSHPFDQLATREMDDAIVDLTREYDGARLVDRPARYKRKQFDSDIPAATLLRKQPVIEYETENELLQVVRRQSFIVRGDDYAKGSNVHFDRQIKNPERFDELTQRVEGYVANDNIWPEIKWLQPIATSYYAKRLAGDASKPLDA